ncbi:adenosine deaminase [Romboutsia ilealis]|uniref:Adenosine deaminase n=1 Tax=Romboutsia faecis TaxID=2764597 RepID=A0ABR7JP17_9FIRM|nr:adenosine deaminase [Romboutsia faecis]MBC5996502.1 adenosine deaminase [Romboutsia faecis]MRN24028.1 adenosine deaminase [Romboutsia ilealis]
MRKLPKIELHCHLDGSVRAETILDIARKENLELPSYNINDIKKLVQVPIDCTSLDEYLKKFDLANKVMQTKESIKRVTFELVEDAANENVKYIEIRFAPMLHMKKGLSIKEVIQSVLKGMNQACEKYEIKANLILGCMRNMSVEDAELVVKEGKEFLGKGVVAIDLCGPEVEGFATKYKKAIESARSYGYRVTIHAGEAASGKNVIDAINLLGAERIGHGINIKDMKEAYDLVKRTNVTLEMCPTSNLHTKAIDKISDYPFFNFYKDDLSVTLNTDNRTVSDVDLTNEISLVKDNFNMSEEDYKRIYLNSVDATFADEDTKMWLKSLI